MDHQRYLRRCLDYIGEQMDDRRARKRDLYDKLRDEFGVNEQIKVAQEECAELIVAISHYRRGRNHNVEEEIADVEIMIEQLRLMFDENKINSIKEKKLERMLELFDELGCFML